MSSEWGEQIKISIFGESHGAAIGVVIGGLPAGISLAESDIPAFMARRAPGGSPLSTARSEPDTPRILSGVLDGKTTGAPLCAMIGNDDAQPRDYDEIGSLARPGHADFTAHIRYNGYNDARGGGHLSGRLTAPLTFAGAVAKAALKTREITVGAHVAAVHGIADRIPANITPKLLAAVAAKPFAVFDDDAGAKMQTIIASAKDALDSVGGIAGCFALGVPAGVGSPIFGGLENKIASILFGIPSVKGLEFGDGFGLASLYGSESNDAFRMVNGSVVTETNRQGGILGGISTGMPVTLRVSFKPTPTIGHTQRTVDYLHRENATITAKGRHDPCIVPRAVPCVESAVAIALLDCMIDRFGRDFFKNTAAHRSQNECFGAQP